MESSSSDSLDLMTYLVIAGLIGILLFVLKPELILKVGSAIGGSLR